MKFAIHTATVEEELSSGHLDALRLSQYAVQLGCHALEVAPSWVDMTGPSLIRQAADATGLELIYASGMRFPSQDERSDPAGEVLEVARILGARQICVLLPHGDPRWEFAQAAADAGITLLVASEPLPGSVLTVRRFVDTAASPSVLALYDTAAPTLVGEDPVRSLYLLNRRIGHVHFTDVKPCMGRLRRTYPGDGTVWWYGVIWGLGALGYQESLTVTFPGKGNGQTCLDLAISYLTDIHASRFPTRHVT